MKKIVEILIVMLMIIAIVLPVTGTINGLKNKARPPLASSVVEWTKIYGGSEFDMLHCVHQTQDGGYLASGVSEQRNRYYPLLLKLDSVGDEEWSWTITQISYGGVLYDIRDVYPIFCNQVSDGGFLFCLWLDIDYEDGVPTIAGLFKFNENGEQEWVEFYSEGFDWIFRPISFIEIEDGYVVAGTSGDPYSYMGEDAGLLKTDTTGIEQWYKEYKYGDYDDRVEAVCRTSDGGYILSGWGRDTSYNYWMIKTDEYGTEQWNKTFGGSGDDFCHTKDCYETDDGGFILGGFSSSFGGGTFDVWIVKTNSIGNMVWNKSYGGINHDVCWGMESSGDGGYVIVATMNYGASAGDREDINLVKINDKGNIVWIQEYGGPGIQLGASVDKTADEGFIIAGCTGSFHSSKSDGLLVKFAPFKNQRPNQPSKPSGPSKGKPDKEYTFTTSASDPDGDALRYKWDWGDSNISEWLDTSKASHIWTTENNFEVKVMVRDDHGGESDWSDPLSVSMSKTKLSINLILFQVLERLIKHFPLLIRLLNL